MIQHWYSDSSSGYSVLGCCIGQRSGRSEGCGLTDIQWFAFVILPLLVAAIGWTFELLSERAERRD